MTKTNFSGITGSSNLVFQNTIIQIGDRQGNSNWQIVVIFLICVIGILVFIKMFLDHEKEMNTQAIKNQIITQDTGNYFFMIFSIA